MLSEGWASRVVSGEVRWEAQAPRLICLEMLRDSMIMGPEVRLYSILFEKPALCARFDNDDAVDDCVDDSGDDDDDDNGGEG